MVTFYYGDLFSQRTNFYGKKCNYIAKKRV